MARKLLDQNEVARMLGITPDEVSSLRDRKKLFPYRDGDQWKFKQEDVESYREEMQAEKGAQGTAEPTNWEAPDDLGDVELQLNDDLDSILLSEIELGKSSTEGASTIIGKPGDGAEPDSDLPPAVDSKKGAGAKPAEGDMALSASDSDITLAVEPGTKGGSTITLAGQPASGGSSGFSLAGDSAVTMGSDKGPAKPGSSKKGSGFGLETDSGISLSDSNLSLASDVKLAPGGSDAGKSGSDHGKKAGGSSDKLFGSDALQLSDDELSLVDAPASDKSKLGDAAKKSAGSSIKLGDEELEVVLGGSGSDVTQSPTDSGIQLISPSDSGLSLDQPLQLGSSARRLLDIEPAVETVEEIGMEPLSDQKSDDDFLLTTSDEVGLQESSDSGSQVIALDTDDELSSGMFGSAATAPGLLEEESATTTTAGATSALMGAPSLGTAPGMLTAPASAEAPYSGANIAILSVCVVLLMFCGMLTYDLMRNMWSWEGAYPVNSSIMDSIGSTVGWLGK